MKRKVIVNVADFATGEDDLLIEGDIVDVISAEMDETYYSGVRVTILREDGREIELSAHFLHPVIPLS